MSLRSIKLMLRKPSFTQLIPAFPEERLVRHAGLNSIYSEVPKIVP